MAIKKENNIAHVLKEYPETAAVFTRYNLNCHSCKGSTQETIGHMTSNYGVDEAAFLKDLNEAVKGS